MQPQQHGTCSALRRLSARFHVDLHPSKSGDILEGVREQLNGQVLRYSESFEGVVMAYDDLKVLTKDPVIHPFFPYLSVDVSAEVLLFKPMPGQLLVGKVNRVSADLISLLVLEVFNASIGVEHIRKEFKCNAGASAWVGRKKEKHSSIEVGSDVRFKVVSTKHVGRFFGIEGSISDANSTGVIIVTSHTELDSTLPDPFSTSTPEEAATQEPSAKKSKKRKAQEAALLLAEAEVDADVGGSGAGGSSSKPTPGADSQHANGSAKHAQASQPSHSSKQEKKAKKAKHAEQEQLAAVAAAAAAVLSGSSGGGGAATGANTQQGKKSKKQKVSSGGGLETGSGSSPLVKDQGKSKGSTPATAVSLAVAVELPSGKKVKKQKDKHSEKSA